MKSATAEKLCTAQAGARDDEVAAAMDPPYSRMPFAKTRTAALEFCRQATELLASDGERERTQRDAILAFAVRVLSAGLLYLTQVVLARWMGGSQYGIYVAVWTWVLILGAMSHLGLNLASMRLAPSYRETKDFGHLRGLIRGVRRLALASGTAVMLVGVLGIWLLSDRIEQSFVLPLYLALVCIPLYALTDVQDGIGRGNGWMSVALVPPYIVRPLLLLASMFAAHVAGLPMNAATAAGGAIVATWLAGLLQALAINRRVRETVPAANPQTDFRAWLTISAPLLVILTAELLLQNTDILVVSRFMAPADVGIYFAAGKTMALIMFVHYAVGSAVAHKFAACHARGDHEGLRTFARDSVNWTFWPSLAGAIAILALGMPLLSLFGPGFSAGYPVMFILVIGFLFRSAVGPAEFLLNMLGEQRLCAAVLFFAAMLNIALNVALVPIFGMTGAAVATALSLMTAASLNALAVWRRLGIKMPVWNNWPKL